MLGTLAHGRTCGQVPVLPLPPKTNVLHLQCPELWIPIGSTILASTTQPENVPRDSDSGACLRTVAKLQSDGIERSQESRSVMA